MISLLSEAVMLFNLEVLMQLIGIEAIYGTNFFSILVASLASLAVSLVFIGIYHLRKFI